ncbi:MAG: hypothetical protein SNF68_00040 [Rikenellaceae bacterium]
MKRLITLLAICAVTHSTLFAYSPKGEKIQSRWASDITPQNAWQSYPRPQLVREKWQNLNGLWEYGVTTQDKSRSQVKFEGEKESKVISEVTFNADREFENLSLWLSIASPSTRVWLNGVEIFSNSTAQTHNKFNQYSVSDYADYLNVGENTLRVEFTSGKKHSFDFGLKGF